MNQDLEPFRTKRAEIGQNPDNVWEILHEGGRRARAIAAATMVEVREALQLPK